MKAGTSPIPLKATPVPKSDVNAPLKFETAKPKKEEASNPRQIWFLLGSVLAALLSLGALILLWIYFRS